MLLTIGNITRRAVARTVLRHALIAGWLGSVAATFVYLGYYESRAGALGNVPQTWPDKVALSRRPHRPTLVLLGHPRCPCTLASLTELSKILQSPAPIQTWIVFVEPRNATPEWRNSPNWRYAMSLPDVQTVADPGAEITRRLGGQTSGQVLLYDAAGHLVFNGGITPLRGQTGTNPGRRAVFDLLAGRDAQHTFHVFGCPLLGHME